jgi:hypothetical protein
LLRRGAGAYPALLVLAGCAKGWNQPPPGGPPDSLPPQVVAIKPDSGAIVPQLRGDLVIRFDEVIQEMEGGAGTPGTEGLGRFVLLSPVAGDVKVSWARSEIHVRPAEGWKAGRVYRLELRPGITDLRRNILKESRVVLFSTGPVIPRAALTGTVVQWVEQRPGGEGLVLAALLPDTVAYRTLADSSGAFRLEGVPAGRYKIYGVIDQNRNAARDRREAYDSAIVQLDSTRDVVLWTFVHDTVGPRVRTAEHIDSMTTRVTFSQALDPARPLDTSRVQVLALPDSAAVPVATVLSPAAYDSLAARERAAAAAADSARRAAADTGRARSDTTRARSDTTRRAGPTRIAAGPAPDAAGDTAAFRALLRQRPVPSDRVVVRMAQALRPGGKYVVRVRGARNLNGAAADGQAVLQVPEPPKPKTPPDSAAAPAPARP